VFSTVKGDGVPLVDEQFGNLHGTFNALEPVPTRFLVDYSPISNRIQVASLIEYKLPPKQINADGSTEGLVGHIDGLHLARSHKEGPLRLEQASYSWSLPLDIASKPLTSATPPGERGLVRAADLADHVRFLAESAELPVIADGSRVVVGPTWTDSPKTLGELLLRLKDGLPAPSLPSLERVPFAKVAGIRHTDGWLCLRHQDWWQREKYELPERWLIPLEESYNSGKGPLLGDLADFAVRLSPAQLSSMSQYQAGAPLSAIGFPLSVFNNFGLGKYFALYGSLSPEQKAQIGAGIGFTELSPSQRDLYIGALLQRTPPNIETFRLLFGKQKPDLSAWQLQVFVSPSKRGHGFDLETTPFSTGTPGAYHWGDEVRFILGSSDRPMLAVASLRLKG
jgi:hypothetical protein